MSLFRAREPFFAGNLPVAVSTDDVYTGDHYLVATYPDKFVEVKAIDRHNALVETATAAPGERRATPRKP